jgi:endonuclease VIII
VVPEGDTIHNSAARLRPALSGQALRRFDAPLLRGVRPRPGERIDTVESHGKHLLIRFASGLVLDTHLQMTGSWHLYRSGARWRKPAHLARVVIEVDGWTAVCFSAPVVRTFAGGASVTPLDHLGPDLCRDDADIGAAVLRMATIADPGQEIADVLLDQRVMAGVGNVFKSEVLFACRVDPFSPLGSLDEATRRRLVETAAAQLRANLRGGPRRTVPGGLAVYGRARRPCLVCATPVRVRYQGPHRRSTYWCPRCQV